MQAPLDTFAQHLLRDLDNRIVSLRQYESNQHKWNTAKRQETIYQTTIAQLEQQLARLDTQLEETRARHEVRWSM